ncbi:MAG TPA: site-specific integrase [Bacteroidota bacterium]|nr:site-specific integrase [Bacteroidota bacterium]
MSPCDGVSLVRIAERRTAYFKHQEFRQLMSAIRENWLRDLVLFAAATGMRQGEILSLRWENVDLCRRIAHVECNSSFKPKGGKMRSVPLSDAAIGALGSRDSSDPSAHVFTLHGKPLMRRWVTTKLRRYIRALKLDRRLNFHSIRHSTASWLAMEGISIYQISKILGHSDVKITQHYYAHLQPDELHDAVNKIKFTDR